LGHLLDDLIIWTANRSSGLGGGFKLCGKSASYPRNTNIALVAVVEVDIEQFPGNANADDTALTPTLTKTGLRKMALEIFHNSLDPNDIANMVRNDAMETSSSSEWKTAYQRLRTLC
jgi:hypothetical protein